MQVLHRYRKIWKLPPLRAPDDSFSRAAQICQMPAEFDFPRSVLPANFHYVGPLRDSSWETTPFPWELLDKRRIVYASLGTLQNRRHDVLRTIAAACQGIDVQLVISHGAGLFEGQSRALPDNPLTVQYVPQRALLARSLLTITHAGLNAVLDSLAAGVPLITMPITYEQPAIAEPGDGLGCGEKYSTSKGYGPTPCVSSPWKY
jgi:MGT family glycosyltransferase